MALQDNWLFNRSVRENIAIANPAAPLEAVIHAATLAGAAAGNNDTYDGGAGNDTLVGGSGADTYRFGVGKGVDTVQENDATADVLGGLGRAAAKPDVIPAERQ